MRILYHPALWELILQFDTNMESFYDEEEGEWVDIFYPYFLTDGSQYDFKWDFGDGTIVQDLMSNHIYTSSATKTVKLYRKRKTKPNIHTVGLMLVPILTDLNFSHAAFTQGVESIMLYDNNITGDLIFSDSVDFSNATIDIGGNTVNEIFLPSSITGTLEYIIFDSNDITQGDIDLSGFNNFNEAYIYVGYSSNATFIPPLSYSGTIKTFLLQALGNSGTLDVSMIDKFAYSDGSYSISLPDVTVLIMPSAITGTLISVAITVGDDNVDISMFDKFCEGSTIVIAACGNATEIKFPVLTEGTIKYLYIEDNTSLTEIDISDIVDYASAASVAINRNNAVSSWVLPALISGSIQLLDLMESTSLDYKNLSVFFSVLSAANGNINMQNCDLAAADVNHYLSDYNNNSSSGLAGRVINVSGINADPDVSSGGYDGIAARNNLITKGFQVYI